MKKPSKTKAKALQACQSLDEAQAIIKTIGEHNREIARLTGQMNDEVADITQSYAEKINPLKLAIDTLTPKLQIWCEANRATLLKDGGKTANLITGEVSWRIRPPSVSLRKIDEVIERLECFGLHRFIRTKKEVNKDAILNEPNAVTDIGGITISTGVEDFIVSPFEIDVKP